MPQAKKLIIVNIAAIISFLSCFQTVQAQTKKPEFTKLRVTGYVRSYVTFRNLKEKNYTTVYAPKTISVNGAWKDAIGSPAYSGFRDALGQINLLGKPTANSEIEINWMIDNILTGQIFNDLIDVNPVQNLNGPLNNPNTIPKRFVASGITLGGAIDTDFGLYRFRLGGIQYYSMSPATLWSYQRRDDLFDRQPWEWETVSFRRYASHYEDKNIARDNRWGSGSIQGITFVGTGLPFRLGMRFAYGKTNNVGGWNSFLSNNNSDVYSGQLNKKIGNHSLAGNFLFSSDHLKPGDFVSTYLNTVRNYIVTAEGRVNLKNVSVYTESGAGKLSNPVDSITPWSPLISLKANVAKEVFNIPLSFQYFYIGRHVVNPNSAIMNSSNRRIQGDFNQTDPRYIGNIFEGGIPNFGQLVNNRQAISASGAYDLKKFRFILATSVQQELENIPSYNRVSFNHQLVSDVRSTFSFYNSTAGPYGRLMNGWRMSYEKINITDTLVNYKKNFNLVDFTAKFKSSLFGKGIIIMNYVNLTSAQDKISFIPVMNKSSFFKGIYEELIIFYSIRPKMTLLGFFGTERNKGNQRTELAPNGKPIDQIGYGYGIGIDFDVSSGSALAIRQKWYDFKDKNFMLDRFKGFDLTFEYKIFFDR